MYFVYVLQSLHHDFRYTGMTQNLERRLSQHDRGSTSSTKFYAPFVIIHSEAFESSNEARTREKYLKSAAGRRWIKEKYP